MDASILSSTNIKTYKGSSLIFVEGEKERVYVSDTEEIESDYSNISDRWLTKVCFVINEEDKKMIQEKKFDKVLFKIKKKTLPMAKYD
ncbi:hypothetical protein VOI54_11865 [Tamlana sp. 2201CG12-4]|uniref:hypothetical protein n=1 Tax=Tamlana sp. 2201CG12-4 TaxID=3112582 RepID=UPI002DB80559|nr:hypothetical protein [Tamlana sp. 2201CG12-4]MEC3907718.1 hypothetical protein [Tamlana sp. 2201CG12-4]